MTVGVPFQVHGCGCINGKPIPGLYHGRFDPNERKSQGLGFMVAAIQLPKRIDEPNLISIEEVRCEKRA
ncbi:MAG: hypothetical protein GY847_33000 [Proteobacteria bacterium]|nr:hypothetical protein [Pseudomonadota bacterium]